MNDLIRAMLPELILIVVACILFLMGTSRKASVRQASAVIALTGLLGVLAWQVGRDAPLIADKYDSFRVGELAHYFKILTTCIGILLVLLAWPTNREATGGAALDFGQEAGEFFALMLLSIAGVFMVAGANDIILLFLALELVSIPTYVMVSMSRPLSVAQEAGVKYFFLGAMSAAIMLFGFSYLYGTTGSTSLEEIAGIFRAQLASGGLTTWQTLAVVMLIVGFAYKIAAVPLHVYAGDVYQGAATPVTAFLAFMPKTAGFIALINLLWVTGGASWDVPGQISKLLWVLAVLTMTIGNVLGLLQFNVKRVLAYSSIAHTGYMLAGLTALISAESISIEQQALQGVLFYLAAYGVMNIGAFGVLMLLPSRDGKPATSAETFDDLAGQGRKNVALGLAMAVCCFSLIGIPLTVGFLGKYYLLLPVFKGHLIWLGILTVVNAAISAAYYLRIVAAMFLRPEPVAIPGDYFVRTVPVDEEIRSLPVSVSVAVSVLLTLMLGVFIPLTQRLSDQTEKAAGAAPGLPPMVVSAGR
jgi:NADH-quinone oxidoreductase subunit N